jgi:hypothetical protein
MPTSCLSLCLYCPAFPCFLFSTRLVTHCCLFSCQSLGLGWISLKCFSFHCLFCPPPFPPSLPPSPPIKAQEDISMNGEGMDVVEPADPKVMLSLPCLGPIFHLSSLIPHPNPHSKNPKPTSPNPNPNHQTHFDSIGKKNKTLFNREFERLRVLGVPAQEAALQVPNPS